MSTEVTDVLRRLAGLPGMRACSLLDIETGMAWLTESAQDQPDCLPVFEAASDYWRLAGRRSDCFDLPLGPLAAQVLIHSRGRLTLVACGQRLLLASLSREPDTVPWSEWKSLVGQLQVKAASF